MAARGTRAAVGSAVEVAPKRLELMRELFPAASDFGMLVNPASPGTDAYLRASQAVAANLGVRLHPVNASTDSQIDAVFATLRDYGWAGS